MSGVTVYVIGIFVIRICFVLRISNLNDRKNKLSPPSRGLLEVSRSTGGAFIPVYQVWNCCMSGLHIHISNRMEILAQALARIVRIPSPSALTPEIIIVQSRGMERWVSMALAELNGICAAAYFPFPNAFLEDLFKKMRPDLPEISPFDS